MTDLTPSRAAAGLGFAYGVGREIILVHVTLGGFLVQTVQLLAVADRSQRSNCQYLCLTTGEQTSTMYTGQHADFRSQRTNLVNASAVHTLALIEPCTDNFLLNQIQDLIDHAGFFAADSIKCFVYGINDRTQTGITFVFIIGIQCVFHLLMYHGIDIFEQFLIDLVCLECELFLADLRLNLGNKGNHFLDFFVTSQNCLQHGIFRHFVCTSFDHDDLVLGTGNRQVQVIVLPLFQCGVQHDLAVYQTNTDAGDRSVPRNIGDRQSDRSGDHAYNIRCTVRIHCHNCHDYRNVIPHRLREQRTNRTVYHTGSQDRLFRGLSLPLGEGAGNLAYGIHTFFVVY